MSINPISNSDFYTMKKGDTLWELAEKERTNFLGFKEHVFLRKIENQGEFINDVSTQNGGKS